MQNTNLIQDYLNSQIKAITDLKEKMNIIEKILDIILEARNNEKQIYVLGNGGSASTSTHFVSDLLKTSITEDEKRFKAMSLSDNIPVILAWSNDMSYDAIFVEQLKNFLQEEDVVIAISGSGNSQNVVNAVNYANKINAKTISLIGKDGGKLSEISKTNLTIHRCIVSIVSISLLCIVRFVFEISDNFPPSFPVKLIVFALILFA
jgi:D-sedoheptulose 7-phosphate isomerase